MLTNTAQTVFKIDETNYFQFTKKTILQLKLFILSFVIALFFISNFVFDLTDEMEVTKQQREELELQSLDLNEQLAQFQILKPI